MELTIDCEGTLLTLIYENVASLRDQMKELREELEGSKL